MKIVMPVAIEFPDAILGLYRAAGPFPVQIVDVSWNDYAYWNLFCSLWHARESFVIVEQDIVVERHTFRSLYECPRRWCAFPYHEAGGEPVTGMGCTKFSPWSDKLPDDFLNTPMRWGNVDTAVQGAMTALGHKVHEHEGWLVHLNPKVLEQQKQGR